MSMDAPFVWFKAGRRTRHRWKDRVDEPHFQLRPGWADRMKESVMLAELCKRKEAGKNYYA